MEEWIQGDIRISTDKSLLVLEDIYNLLASSYWAGTRDLETIKHSIENSICYGVYDKKKQIGFARVVTDSATMYWLSDVIIDKAYRGRGLGKALIEYIKNSKEVKGLLGVLKTQDAHGLYRQYGFIRDTEKMMVKPRRQYSNDKKHQEEVLR